MNQDETIDEIRRDIEDTRQRISTEIEALEGKLTPAHAKEVVRENVKERIVETKQRFVESVNESASMARENASRVMTDLVSTARANPIPLAMIGVGAGWLVWQTVRPRREIEIEVEPLFELESDASLPSGTFREGSGYEEVGSVGDDVSVSQGIEGRSKIEGRIEEVKAEAQQRAIDARQRAKMAFEDARQRAREAASTTKERASDLSHDARERGRELAIRGRDNVRHAGDLTVEAYQANPIAFGALAFAVGMGLAMALPHTRREDELLGHAGGRVVGRAREIVDSAKTVAKDAVREGASAARESAKHAVDEGKLAHRELGPR